MGFLETGLRDGSLNFEVPELLMSLGLDPRARHSFQGVSNAMLESKYRVECYMRDCYLTEFQKFFDHHRVAGVVKLAKDVIAIAAKFDEFTKDSLGGIFETL